MNTQLDLIKNDWLDDVQTRVVSMLPSLGQFTTDTLHDAIRPEPTERNWWGCLMARLKNAGLVESVGYETSKRKEANGRKIAVWKMKG